ncbi:MAG: type secretory pathway, pseudopilin PulG [Pedosphaera sp.]|nr:type secretory pathway, pseudopilin PulG [Pedosphaera sp.]
MKFSYTDKQGRAFTVAELMVTIAVVAFVALFLLPPMLVHRKAAVRIKCVSNLKMVGLAFRIWSGDNNDLFPMGVYTNATGAPLFTNSASAFRYFQVMSNELSNPQVLICPLDTKRRAATNFTTDFNGSNISFFVGLDADEAFPQRFLAGDSNIKIGKQLQSGLVQITTNQAVGWTAERHQGFGNVALADGSVAQISSPMLMKAFQDTGLATNLLLMPP